jgi:hypothetical protein
MGVLVALEGQSLKKPCFFNELKEMILKLDA